MTAATRRSTSTGYTTGIIDQAQFSVLVAVVVLSAVVPTAIAQRLFTPKAHPVARARQGHRLERATPHAPVTRQPVALDRRARGRQPGFW
jgi:hypothetical protein